MTYRSETRPLLVEMAKSLNVKRCRWMCGISMKDRRTNENLRRLVGVEPKW